jgi:hypothetical protein
MLNKAQYEKRILEEIRSIPEQALPKIIRVISLIKHEFIENNFGFVISDEEINHTKTRQLLASSKSNWSKEVIDDREDRI